MPSGRLEATSEVARAVGGETDIEFPPLLETIVKRARALVEARSLVILLEDQSASWKWGPSPAPSIARASGRG